MSVGTATVNYTLTMTVTDLAKEKLAAFLSEGKSMDEHGVKIGVAAGGCSGASYTMGYAAEPENDEMTLVSNGVKLFVNPEHAMVLNGLVVDFLDELMGGGFKIHNPNATSSCGCGKSFSA
jgi:iron-sulfur cluster assembly protein